jgi:hypothetical protein
MPVPNQFGTATSAIPLSQLDANFDAPITLGNTAIQLGNTVTTLNNMTLANVTISSGTITITNVAVTTANVSGTANISTLVVLSNATVGGNTTITGNITAANANVTSNLELSGGTANGVAYLNTSKQVTTGTALVFDGTKLGIGTTSPSAKLDVKVASDAKLLVQEGNTAGNVKLQAVNNAVSLNVNLEIAATNTQFFNGGSERARIDSSGNLLVGKTALGVAVGTSIDANTSTGSGVRVVSSASTGSADGFQMYSTGAGAFRFYVSFDGTISATTTTISAISDIRYKENVRDLDAGLAEVMALKPRKFDWKEGKGADIKNARGFIAQEFETVFPDLIDEWKDPAPEGEDPYKSVRQDLIPVLVKAIQEQQALITQLTARITALEGA